MKPTSYRNQPAYGRAMQAQQAAVSNSAQAIPGYGADMIEAAFYQQSLDRSLQLGYLGLQKEQFNKTFDENQRRFNVSTAENQRQFATRMDFARDQFKYQRRQDNRAEVLAMANVGMSIGFGYLQYKQQRRKLKDFQYRMQVYDRKG